MKKLLTVILAVLLCMGLSSCVKMPLDDDIYIFFTSDVHCGIEENLTFASMKAVIDDTKAEHKYVTLVDVGDFVQGGAIGSLSKGSLVVELMNVAGYDLATFGNHEFDYGMDSLKQLIADSDFGYVASNVDYFGSGESFTKDVPTYVIKQYGSVKVGFIGIITPTSFTSSTPDSFKENGEFVYDFYGGDQGKKLAEKVQSVVDEVRKQKVDYVVALSHLGYLEKYKPYDSITLIHNTNGIDVVLDGHAHAIVVEDKYPNKDGKDVILSSVGTKLEALGQLIIGKDGSLTTMHIDQYSRQDETMLQAIDKTNKELDHILSQEIGSLDHDMKIYDEEGIRMSRSRETTVGNFVSDAYRYAMGTDIAFVNGGGVRADMNAGTITYNDLMNVNPFQNDISSCNATGQQILDALEYGAQNTEKIYKFDGNAVGEYGGFMIPSGLKYTIDTSIASQVEIDDQGIFKSYKSDLRRVKDVYVLVDGEYVELDPNKTYSVAMADYIMSKDGDGNTAFASSEHLNDKGMVDVNALIDYFKSIEDFSDKYTSLEGRITIQ